MSQAKLAPPPRRLTRWWWIAVPVVVIAVLIGLVVVSSRRLEEPGKRTQIVFPGGASSAAFGGAIKLEIAPDLRDEIQADLGLGAMMGSIDQTFIFRREISRHEIFVTPSKQAMQSDEIRFTLFDAAGAEISTGLLWPIETLQPNVKSRLLIGDFELGRTAKVVLSKAEK